jgi:hypothetical protein
MTTNTTTAVLKNVEMYWVKLDPNKPAPAFGDGGPKWEFQARTTSKEQRDEWKALNIPVKLVEDEATGTVYYKTSFRRSVTKKDDTPQTPVSVVNGALRALDPNTIGNGSICNIRIFQYPYEVKSKQPGGPSKSGISTMLTSVQVTKLIKYVPKPRENDFEATETEVIEPEGEGEDDSFSEMTPGASADPNF